MLFFRSRIWVPSPQSINIYSLNKEERNKNALGYRVDVGVAELQPKTVKDKAIDNEKKLRLL